MQKISASSSDRSITRFSRDAKDWTESNKRLLREYVEGFHAAHPHLMSLQASAAAERAAENEDGSRQFRVTAGYGALLDWFERGAPDPRGSRALRKRR